jgi:outer membrane protein TolC
LDVRIAEESKDLAQSAGMPHLNARGGYKRYINSQPLTPVGGNPKGIVATDEIAEANLGLDMPLYTGGRIRNQIAAAEFRQRAASGSANRIRKRLIHDIFRVFYDILAQRHVVEALESNRSVLAKHLENVKIRIANNKATKVDRLRTEVRLSEIQSQLAEADNALESKRHSLKTLMGVRHIQTPEITGELAHREDTEVRISSAVNNAYQKRSDYQSARANRAAKRRELSAAEAQFWPTISLNANYASRWDVSNPETRADVGQAGIDITLPIFIGGRIRSNVEKHVAELDSSREQLRALELNIRYQVQKAINDVNSARQRIKSTEKSIQQAKEGLRAEQTRYRHGKASITDVLDAQSELISSQKNYYRALAAWNTAKSALRLATGKDYSIGGLNE